MVTKELTRDDLRSALRREDLTHQAVADEIGIARSAVTDVLSGRNRSPATRYAIARVLDVDPDRVRWDEEAT